MHYPKQCTTLKSTVWYWFVWQEYTFNTGRSLVHRLGLSFLPELMSIVYLTQTLFGVTWTPSMIPLLVGIGIFLVYVIGWLFVRNHMDVIQGLVDLERHPFQRAVYKKVMGDDSGEKL